MPGGLDIYKRVCTLMGLILNESLRGKKKNTCFFQQNGMVYHICTRQCKMFLPPLTTGDFIWKVLIYVVLYCCFGFF